MIKKSILCLIILFSMSGCSAVVNINIDKNRINEEYLITGNSSDYEKIKETISYPIPLEYDAELENPFSGSKEKEEGVAYYNITTDDISKKAIIKGSFSLNNHTNSNIIRNCFKYYNILKDGSESKLIFSTSRGLTCNFNKFTLNIKSPYKILESNASKIDEENNIYTWQSNDKNSRDFSVYFNIDLSKKYKEDTQPSDSTPDVSDNTPDTQSNFNSSVLIIIGVILLIFIIAGTIILTNKKRKASSL